eukprot:873334-Lingulodinium_polyedra.AAC.1
MLGPMSHKLFDAQVFYLDEEMRKPVETLAGAIVMTAQEKPKQLRKYLRLGTQTAVVGPGGAHRTGVQ